jgi:basic membrane protein A
MRKRTMFQFKSKEAKEVKHVSGHRIRVISILMTVILLLATLPGCIEEEERLNVAVLYIGPIGDYGWTYEGHLGAQREACGPDAPQIMRECAETENKVIFCHSYNFGKYIEEVASDYPEVIFMWGAGVEKKAPNAGIYFGRMYEVRFLAGMVAGLLPFQHLKW